MGNFVYNPTKIGMDATQMESDDFGLIDDIFLVNELNSRFPNSIGDSSPLSSSEDELLGALMKSAMDERKPFDSFEKQITITVPQPPPLKADAFAIGGGLFDGMYSTYSPFSFLQLKIK